MAKHQATEIGPFAGEGFVCLAYQSCENNHVCVASSLSRWSIISGPSVRMAHTVCVDHCGIWVRGTPLAGTASVFFSIRVMAAMVKQTRHKPHLYWASFYANMKMVIDKCHQVQCEAKMSLSFINLKMIDMVIDLIN